MLGLIASIIAIIETAQTIYEAADDAQGLPKKFRAAAEQIPLVYHTLSLAEHNIRAQKVNDQALQSVTPVLERCKQNAANIKEIFDKTIPAKDASRPERLRKAVGILTKSKKVKEEMEEMVTNMELLAQHQVFQDAAALQEIQTAIEQLNNLPDDEEMPPPQFSHSGAGPLSVNMGSGKQQINTLSGSGRQFIAEQQTFGRDQGMDPSI